MKYAIYFISAQYISYAKENQLWYLASERDTIRGVQIRAGAVRIYIYMYGGTYVIIVVHATHM